MVGIVRPAVVPVRDGRAGSLVLVRPGTDSVTETGMPPVMITWVVDRVVAALVVVDVF